MGRGAKGNTGSGAKVSLAELKKHSSAEDAWIVIDGKVCALRPGSDAIHFIC